MDKVNYTIKEYPSGKCSVFDPRHGVNGCESILYDSRELAEQAAKTGDLEFDIELMEEDEIIVWDAVDE